ncbi:hypothetical protein AB0L68_36800 [Streptomyces sp. NPDC052164]|uniref:hypothetical protein n=1 Tax=Streptomyces sp. NPDC052164 TaxID=3155529 RepID=UPI00341BB2EA
MRSAPLREDRPTDPSASAGSGLGRVLGGPWLLTGHDGRLTAYVHVDDAVLRWTEVAPGSRHWSGPEAVPAKGIDHLTLVQGRDRYAHLVGRRVRSRADDWSTVDIMHATQYQTGRPVTQWRSLGNPFKEVRRAVEVGAPQAAVAGDGALYVCVPTGLGGLSLRREDKHGQWEAWRNLPVAGVTDRPVPAALSSGLMEILIPVRTGALHLCQAKPGGDLVPGAEVAVIPLPGSVTALETAAGRLTYYLSDARGAGAFAVRAGQWPVPLGGEPGDGRISALRTALDGVDCTVLAVRGASGTVGLGACTTEGEQAGVWWTDTAMRCAGDPALACDGQGRLAVAAIGADRRLAVARQQDGQGLTLSDWYRI